MHHITKRVGKRSFGGGSAVPPWRLGLPPAYWSCVFAFVVLTLSPRSAAAVAVEGSVEDGEGRPVSGVAGRDARDLLQGVRAREEVTRARVDDDPRLALRLGADVKRNRILRLDPRSGEVECVWAHPGMSTYYRNSKGRIVVNSPHRNVDFFEMTKHVNLWDYVTEPSRGSKNRLAWRGRRSRG